jgi:hypothetical protein
MAMERASGIPDTYSLITNPSGRSIRFNGNEEAAIVFHIMTRENGAIIFHTI